MVKPMLRSRSRKKIKTRTPGARTVTHYRDGKHSKKTCARCEAVLPGVATGKNSEMKKLSKTEKVPTRTYAGVLCADCTEKLLRYSTRMEVKFKYPEYSDLDLARDLTLERYLPRGWYKSISGASG